MQADHTAKTITGHAYHTVKTSTGEYSFLAIQGEDRLTCLRRHALEMATKAQELSRRAVLLLEATKA